MMRALLATILWSVGVGCAPQRMMPAPSIVVLGYVEPLADVAEDRRQTTGTVFIASNRALAEQPDGTNRPFSNARSHLLHLASSEVTVGRGLGWDELVEATSATRRSERPVIEVQSTEVFGVLPTPSRSAEQTGEAFLARGLSDAEPVGRWLASLNAALDAGAGSDILVYVHGFNTNFLVNTGMAAEMWHYAGREGAVVSFAWPSRYRLLGYGADKANADYAVRHLRLLLEFLAERSNAERIHILAHSAGCPIVVDAMRELRLIDSALRRDEVLAKYRIGRVVLAAPDMDLMRFFNAKLDGFDDLAEWVSIYASSEDDALLVSGWLFGEERLGDSVGHLTEWERQEIAGFVNAEIVDVTKPEDLLGDFLGHSYYHRDPWVSSDVLLMLKYGLSAAERGLVHNGETGFWEFPDDYLDRLGGILGPEPPTAE